ncbi:MAG: DNA-directed RNA polymerase sigma-70 factor [bacterium]|nr:MAG: DNA-directed RNA polymerase sigma-70 factor [bacterium]
MQHNGRAQKTLYDMYAAKMMGLCLRYTKNKSDAEDIFQEGSIKVFENIHQLQKVETLEWWIKKIFINEALQLFKHRKKTDFAYDYNSTPLPTRETNEILQRLGVEEITQLIQELPSGMQMVLNLYIIEGYPHKEIAKLMGISEGTTKSQLHDARKILQKKLIQSYQ